MNLENNRIRSNRISEMKFLLKYYVPTKSEFKPFAEAIIEIYEYMLDNTKYDMEHLTNNFSYKSKQKPFRIKKG